MKKRKNAQNKDLRPRTTDALGRPTVSFNDKILTNETALSPEELLIQDEEGGEDIEATIDDYLERLDPACTREQGGLINITELAKGMGYSRKQAEKLIYSRSDSDFIHAIDKENGVTVPSEVDESRRKKVALISTTNSMQNYGNICRTDTCDARRARVPGWFPVNHLQCWQLLN